MLEPVIGTQQRNNARQRRQRVDSDSIMIAVRELLRHEVDLDTLLRRVIDADRGRRWSPTIVHPYRRR